MYGTIEPKSDSVFNAVATYSIDGSSHTPNIGSPGNKTLYSQLLYRSPNLADGQHTLVITSTLGGGSMFWLDYLEMVPTGASPSPNSTASLPNPSPSFANSIGSSDTATLSATSVSGPSSIGGGAIAGIAIGGFFCVLLVLFFVWLYRRKTSPAPFDQKPEQSTSSLPCKYLSSSSFQQISQQAPLVWDKRKRVSIEVTPFNLAFPPPTPPILATQRSHFHREDIQSNIITTSPPSQGYFIGTSLVEKRGVGANHNTVSNSQATDGSSTSRTLATPSSLTVYGPTVTSGPRSGKRDHGPPQRSGTSTFYRRSDGPPAYA